MKVAIILSLVVVAFLALASANPEPDAPVYGAPAQGWGWAAPTRYLNLRIPIPRLPKISLGVNAGFRASVGHNQGWGWGK